MKGIFRLFTISLLVYLFSSCGQTNRTFHDKIDCNVADYTFTLGDSIQKIKKEWTLLEENTDLSYGDSVRFFSLTWEEHLIGFYFYNSELISVTLSIPRSELVGHSIEIAGEIISIDLSSDSKKIVKRSNYTFECSPIDFDGMKDFSFLVGYSDAKTFLTKTD